MTDPEKLRALVGYVQHKSDCGRTIARIRFGDADRGDCTCGLSTLLTGAERPTPSVELPKRNAYELARDLRKRALLLTGEKWELEATKAMMIEASDALATPPVEDAVTRAKLEMLDKVKSAILAIPAGEFDPVLIWMSVHKTIDALRAHLKGSLDAD
jgi:hypothetical protein